jgi:hypothetical protein
VAEDGVEGRNDRHVELLQQAHDALTVWPPVDPELVLQRNHVKGRSIQAISDPQIVEGPIGIESETDFRRESPGLAVDSGDLDRDDRLPFGSVPGRFGRSRALGPDRGRQVRRKRSDTTLPGRIRPYKGAP